jgi:hypothetical protein
MIQCAVSLVISSTKRIVYSVAVDMVGDFHLHERN